MSKTVLLTGAAGGVAAQLRPYLRARYDDVLLSDLSNVSDVQPGERFVQADLTDRGALRDLTRGVHGVVHLGGQSVEADWETVLQANIIGLYNIFEACRENGVERFIFASSNHAIGMYSRDQRIGSDHRVRPDSRYGLSKATGEAMGAMYADKHGMRVLSIRIGNVGDRPLDRRRLSIWIHPDDLMQLFTIGLEHADLHHAIVYGASKNARNWWDNSEATRLGYRPTHDAETFAADVLSVDEAPDNVADAFQGGTFSAAEFSGDFSRTRYS